MSVDPPRLRLGVLGCASVAVARILPAVAGLATVELTAVASRRPGVAEAVTSRYGGRPVTSYEELLGLPEVEAVYVPLPPALHAPWVERALLAGKHVLAEKPLTTNPEDTARLVDLAEARGIVLRENYMFPHHSQHSAVRELVAEGIIGDLRAFAAVFAIPPRPARDIRHRPDLGGGALLDVGGYPVRAAQLFLGSELAVAGASLRYDRTYGVDIGGGVLLRRQDGVPAQLTFGMEHAYTSWYELLGSDGRIRVEHVFTPPAQHRPVLRLERQDHREERILPADDQVANALTAFARQIRSGSAAADRASVVQAALVGVAAGLAAR